MRQDGDKICGNTIMAHAQPKAQNTGITAFRGSRGGLTGFLKRKNYLVS